MNFSKLFRFKIFCKKSGYHCIQNTLGILLSGLSRLWHQILYRLDSTIISRVKFYILSKREVRSFKLQGSTYNYFYHIYNRTWRHERAVEIPIIWEAVKKYHAENVLEIGNVLSHYFSVNHAVLDKYEKADGVINEDVVDFKPIKTYDLIISISTLEHVGIDDIFDKGDTINFKSSKKVTRAIENLKACLSSKGELIITVPLGYNQELDDLLRMKGVFTEVLYLKRISKDNMWKETSENDCYNMKFNSPFKGASGLAIGIFKNNV